MSNHSQNVGDDPHPQVFPYRYAIFDAKSSPVQVFGAVSGLHLKTAKCVVIPLDGGTLEAFSNNLGTHIPEWRHMWVTHSAKYLGLKVGPAKGDTSWNEPAVKFLARCEQWVGQPLGLQYSSAAYNIFAISTLGYVTQLEAVPPDMLKNPA